MNTQAISAEPIDGYLESCYAAFRRGDPRPELPPEIGDALDSETRGRFDEVVERLRRQAESRRGCRKRQCRPKASAKSRPRDWPDVPGYEITGQLGEGGFGRVYRAISLRHFGVPVALKILRPQVLSRTGWDAPERRLLISQRLVDEARILAHIGHRNVVRYLGSGIIASGLEAGTPFVATELIDGRSLADRIGGAPQDPRWSARVLAQIADALDFVHQLKLQRPDGEDDGDAGSGILHRDVKPSNILLGPGEEPFLTDFGLAGRIGRASSDEGFIGGTAAYSAPEQLHTDAVLTPAVDVHGLGATLYHLLAGKPPQYPPEPDDRGRSEFGRRPISPRGLARGIPVDLERICLTCLEHDPSRRYHTAGAVRDDLQRFFEGKPVSVNPVGLLGSWARRARHRPLAAGLAASLLLSLLIGLSVTSWLWRRADAERARAETDFEVASAAFDGFAEATYGGAIYRTNISPQDTLIPLLRRARENLLAMSRRRPSHHETHFRLACAAHELGHLLMMQSRLDEARPLFLEALASLDRVIAKEPHHLAALHRQTAALGWLGQIAERQQDVEASADYSERALLLREEVVDRSIDFGQARDLSEMRYDLAVKLVRLGRSERARSVLEADARILDDARWDDWSPEISIRRALALDDLRRFGANDACKSDTGSRDAEPDAFRSLLTSEADHRSPGEWANQFVRLMISKTPTGKSDRISESGYRTVRRLGRRAAEHRYSGSMDEAGRIADRIHALARRLVALFPDDSAAYLALCESHTQLAKNAWKVPDFDTIERNLTLARDAANRALTVKLGHPDALPRSVERQERLDKFLASRKKDDAHEPSSRSRKRG